MADQHVSKAQVSSFQNARRIFERENKSHKKADERTAEKKHADYVNEHGKKGSSQKRPQRLEESSGSFENVHENRGSSLHKKHSDEDLALEEMLSTDLHDDELSLGAPLSIKNFFKAVKSFSKRPAKGQKTRLEHLKDSKDTDVVVFERPTTPRANTLPPGVSRSLPPVLDFHELFGSHTTIDNAWEDDVHNKKHEQLTRSKTEENESTTTPKSLRRVGRQLSPVLGNGIRLHRCAGALREVESEPDALQEFGSFDFSTTTRRAGRKSRKNIVSSNNQLDELDALHF